VSERPEHPPTGEPEAPVSGFEEEREPEPSAEPPEAAEPAEASALEQDIGELQEKARERDEYLALAQRTQADFENYRKRVARDIAASEARGMGRLARELLPALDSLALAVKAETLDTEGLRLVRSEFAAALERMGIEEFSPEGERFDPNLHEAMAQQPVDGAEPGTVVEVYQRGYRIDGNVLRPARVVVAQ
jgi:molecular chaperone GrpE